jgi:hypothetical protein
MDANAGSVLMVFAIPLDTGGQSLGAVTGRASLHQ